MHKCQRQKPDEINAAFRLSSTSADGADALNAEMLNAEMEWK
jgi:hypothetical protein